jgi:predicted dinucleotide-binding enzyme
LQLFQNISYLDLVEGEMVGALAGCCGGFRAVDRGSVSQVESMASHREMLIEFLNYRGFIGGNYVS